LPALDHLPRNQFRLLELTFFMAEIARAGSNPSASVELREYRNVDPPLPTFETSDKGRIPTKRVAKSACVFLTAQLPPRWR
jgi:hypothetical protein